MSKLKLLLKRLGLFWIKNFQDKSITIELMTIF